MEEFQININSFCYPECRESALQDIKLTIKRGEWVVICGESGSGKSTLLSLLKPEMTPTGTQNGDILWQSKPLTDFSPMETARGIGYVMQNPQMQLVTPYVWSELAFGLENLGVSKHEIRSRVAETVAFFGMQENYPREVNTLSGGQMQLLNLAAVMVMNPKVLILDEPTAGLDPIAASDFLHMLYRIHEELGMTIIMSEHQLEEVLSYTDSLVVMNHGTITLHGSPREILTNPVLKESPIYEGMPVVTRLYQEYQSEHSKQLQKMDVPLSIGEGKRWFSSIIECLGSSLVEYGDEKVDDRNTKLVQCKRIWFAYPEGDMILKDLDFSVYKGEVHALIGGNGCGKSTLLNVMAGWYRVNAGRMKKQKDISCVLLPQQVNLLLLRDSVEEELYEMTESEERIQWAIEYFYLETIRYRHPRDISGGEQQRLAFAKVVLSDAKILLLDEPTRGMDGSQKLLFGKWLSELVAEGRSILVVTHDLEFAAKWARRVSMMFDGAITISDTPRNVFAGNHFYTTASNRIAGEFSPRIILPKEVHDLWDNTNQEKENI